MTYLAISQFINVTLKHPLKNFLKCHSPRQGSTVHGF